MSNNRFVWSRELIFILTLVLFLVIIFWGQVPASGSADVVFEPVSNNLGRNSELDANVMREGQLKFSQQALNSRSNSDLTLNLFNDVTLDVQFKRLDRHGSNGTVWVGVVDNDPLSEVLLSWQDGVVYGHIQRNGELYRIQPDVSSRDLHLVQQLSGQFKPGAEPLEPIVKGEPISMPDLVANRATEAVTVDILVIYSPAARSEVGGTSAMENLIYSAVSQTNSSYENSDVNISLNLVHVDEISFEESSNIVNDLTSLASNSTVAAMRDRHGADLVSLVRKDAGPYCGIAYVMSPPSNAFDSSAYSVVTQDCAVSNLSFAHETGHNFGAQHDRANAGSFPGAYSFSYGYQHTGSNPFRTIMAYSNGCPSFCQRVSYWSNSSTFYNGQPTGVYFQFSNSAENFRTLNNTAPVVASFREEAATPTPTPTNTPTATNTPTPTNTPTNTPTPTPTFTPTPLPTILATIEANQSANLVFSDFRFDFPSGAFTETVEVNIVALNPVDLPEGPSEGMDTTKYQYVVQAVSLDTRAPQDLELGKEFNLTIFYEDEGVQRIKEKTMGIFYWDPAETNWTLAANQDFVENSRISADGSILTYLAIMGEEKEKVYLPIIFNDP
ncbi:MAG: M12 family metallo-peptidase [Chloroflexota bacterium]